MFINVRRAFPAMRDPCRAQVFSPLYSVRNVSGGVGVELLRSAGNRVSGPWQAQQAQGSVQWCFLACSQMVLI